MSGGGARAAYQVGLLRWLARRHPDLRVSILTGVSAGAINAAFLACHTASFRERAVAVVLSGTGSDGAMGVKAIKKMGGTVIVQDKESSEFFGMPEAAMRTGAVDFVLPLAEIAPALHTLVTANGTP